MVYSFWHTCLGENDCFAVYYKHEGVKAQPVWCEITEGMWRQSKTPKWYGLRWNTERKCSLEVDQLCQWIGKWNMPIEICQICARKNNRSLLPQTTESSFWEMFLKILDMFRGKRQDKSNLILNGIKGYKRMLWINRLVLYEPQNSMLFCHTLDC